MHHMAANLGDEEDQTRTYSPETVDKLLHSASPTGKPQSSAADDVTRVGEIPIEQMIRAQSVPSNKGVGHEDVTRVYDLPVGESMSEATSPRKRVAVEPLVIVQPEPPKSRWGWWVACGLLVAAIAAGWVYRAPLVAQAKKWQSSHLRGVASPKSGGDASQSVAVPVVTVSVSVSPADARLLLDGAPVTNPFTTQRPSDKQLHDLVAEAPGFATLRRSVQFERDLTVVLALAPLPAAAATQEATQEKETAPASAASEPAPRTRAVRVRPKQTPTDAPSEPAASTNKNCNPPYTIDDAGIKTYKPECLQ